jgi:hypothetical protein
MNSRTPSFMLKIPKGPSRDNCGLKSKILKPETVVHQAQIPGIEFLNYSTSKKFCAHNE